MPKTFDVPVVHGNAGDVYTIQPFAVTFIRPQQFKRALHETGCHNGNDRCRIQHPENAVKHSMMCAWSAAEDVTEICFVNTVGPQSSVTTALTPKQVKDLLDEAVRYNL